jgi:HD superfamily phosphohydrolase
MEVRDPIHGGIEVSSDELAVLDNPFVQRLRNIRQTGFSHLPFPGATHSRYAHCLGAMHLSGQAFDRSFRRISTSTIERRVVWRSLVRVAALCHDLGHAPFSHCSEFAMPPLSRLGVGWYPPGGVARAATHEDYTVAILEHTALADVIARRFPFTARHVAALISGDVLPADDLFVDGGLDHRRILSQIISSELDVDRLDYLVRDSYFTGARYGQVDTGWILSNLDAHTSEGHVGLALDASAIYAFDDYMIARHHMFLMVYFHHKSVIFEEMLKRHVASPECGWSLPADLGAYLHVDDISLEHHLRSAETSWARRIVERRPYRRVVERHGTPEEVDLATVETHLRGHGLDVVHAASTGTLSRYNGVGQKRERAPVIHVIDRMPGSAERVRRLDQATDVFDRYAEARRIARLYVAPEDTGRAREVLARRGAL